MGNTCDFTPWPVQSYRDWRERSRAEALRRLVAEHINTEKLFDASISQLRAVRRDFEARRLQLKELCIDKKEPSQEVIDECYYFTCQIAMCSGKIKTIRTKLLGITKQRTELQNTHYSRQIQKGWKKIVAEYKKIDINLDELEEDGEKATEAMEDFKEFNAEAEAIAEGVFGVTADSDEEKERIKKESLSFLGLEYRSPQQRAPPKRAAAAAATAVRVAEEREKLLSQSLSLS